MKTSEQIRQEFLDFWTEEPRNFQVVPNMSLVPNMDSTLLFVNSGMFPLVPYLSGQPHPLGKRLCDIQRCLRTNYDEMLEIGDNRHTLMFEMLGDWSLGDFTKEEQIPWILELHVERYGLDPKRLYISVFGGDHTAPRDDVAIETWKKAFHKYGIEAEFSEDITNIPTSLADGENWKYRIFPYGKKKNWWLRAEAPGELGGPSSEMFYDMGKVDKQQEQYHINDDSGRFIEIGNNVFMEYKYDQNMKWEPLEQRNIDFGGGFERVNMIIQGKNDIYETDIYQPIISKITELSGRQYKTDGVDNEYTANFRILADHSRAAAFILADGVVPSNKDQGYILRRFIRRLVRYGVKIEMPEDFTKHLAQAVITKMSVAYPHLQENAEMILSEIAKEEIKFRQTLTNGLKELERIEKKGEQIDGSMAFFIYETFGFPLEMTLDELGVTEDLATQIEKEFDTEVQKHRAASRTGAEQKFKGGLADQSAETTKLHTAHHLLLAGLQKFVDPNIRQRGSNITAERLRIDFNLDRKLTGEETNQVETWVNEQIQAGLPVTREEMPKSEAVKIGAQMEFGAKYPEIVSVYIIGDPDNYVSAEFCGGPHVSNTSEIGEGGKTFKISKEESSGAGIRRIKAQLV